MKRKEIKKEKERLSDFFYDDGLDDFGLYDDEEAYSKEILAKNDSDLSEAFLSVNPDIDTEKHIQVIAKNCNAATAFHTCERFGAKYVPLFENKIYESHDIIMIYEFISKYKNGNMIDYILGQIVDMTKDEWLVVLKNLKLIDMENIKNMYNICILNSCLDKALDLCIRYDEEFDLKSLKKLLVEKNDLETLTRYISRFKDEDSDKIFDIIMDSRIPKYAYMLDTPRFNQEKVLDVIENGTDVKVALDYSRNHVEELKVSNDEHINKLSKVVFKNGNIKDYIELAKIFGQSCDLNFIRFNIIKSNDYMSAAELLKYADCHKIYYKDLARLVYFSEDVEALRIAASSTLNKSFLKDILAKYLDNVDLNEMIHFYEYADSLDEQMLKDKIEQKYGAKAVQDSRYKISRIKNHKEKNKSY